MSNGYVTTNQIHLNIYYNPVRHDGRNRIYYNPVSADVEFATILSGMTVCSTKPMNIAYSMN